MNHFQCYRSSRPHSAEAGIKVIDRRRQSDQILFLNTLTGMQNCHSHLQVVKGWHICYEHLKQDRRAVRSRRELMLTSDTFWTREQAFRHASGRAGQSEVCFCCLSTVRVTYRQAENRKSSILANMRCIREDTVASKFNVMCKLGAVWSIPALTQGVWECLPWRTIWFDTSHIP